MNRALLVALFLLCALACKPRIVYVPTPCPPPPHVAKPVLPVSTMPPGTMAAERERLLWVSLALSVGYATALERVIDAYRPKAGER